MRLSSTWSKQYCAFLFLIVFDNVPNVISQVIYVNRIAGKWKPDKFGSASTPTMCNTFNGANDVGASKCACPPGNPERSTFLYKPYLTCVSNAQIENILEVPKDCNNDLLYFLNQDFKSPFVVFDLTTSIYPNAIFDNFVKTFEGKCEVQQQAFYINDLSGKTISTFGGKAFTIDKTSKQLQWNLNATLQDTLRGRIVRLKLTNCTVEYKWDASKKVNNPCIVFKVQGTVNFPILTSSTTSITKKTATITAHSVSSSTSTITVKPTSTFTTTSVHPSKSSSVVLVTTTLHRVSIHPSSLQTPIISTLSSGTLTPTSTIHGRSTTTVVPFKPTDTAGHRKNESKDSDPTAAIVGALVAVIGVVIVVVLLVVWRRRKRNQNEEKEKDTNKGNPTYGRGETIDLSNQHNLRNTDNEYDYAAVDGDPRFSSSAAPGIYQSLTKDPNRESVYTPLDRQQDIPSDQSTGYDKVEHPVFKPPRKGPTEPLYNVLERPNEGQLEPGTHDTPTGQSTGYEKVEHPVFQPPRKGPTDPLYNVLARPNEGQLEPGTHDTPTGQSTGYEKVEHPVFQPARKGPTDPLYNVLGRSNGNNHDYMEPGVNIDKAPQNNEPVYNVLEGPAEDPDYNVLEDPNEQYEPEYNVLEGPGDKPDNVPVDGHDNVGYASTIDLKSRGAPIYAAPEGPISEPTYQPLNVNGPGENVYQPLDRKSRVVPDDQPLYHVLESTTSDA